MWLLFDHTIAIVAKNNFGEAWREQSKLFSRQKAAPRQAPRDELGTGGTGGQQAAKKSIRVPLPAASCMLGRGDLKT